MIWLGDPKSLVRDVKRFAQALAHHSGVRSCELSTRPPRVVFRETIWVMGEERPRIFRQTTGSTKEGECAVPNSHSPSFFAADPVRENALTEALAGSIGPGRTRTNTVTSLWDPQIEPSWKPAWGGWPGGCRRIGQAVPDVCADGCPAAVDCWRDVACRRMAEPLVCEFVQPEFLGRPDATGRLIAIVSACRNCFGIELLSVRLLSQKAVLAGVPAICESGRYYYPGIAQGATGGTDSRDGGLPSSVQGRTQSHFTRRTV